MKRGLVYFLAAMLILSLFTACKGTETSVDDSTDTTTTTTTTAAKSEGGEEPTGTEEEEEPVKLSMMVQDHAASPLKSDWLIWDIHGENANVILDVSGYQGNWWEAIPIIVASGDMPDLMWMVSDDANKYGGQGALVDYYDYLDEMPNLRAFMDKYPEQVPPVLSANGKMFLHPAYGCADEYSGMFLYRQDIFEKHDLEVAEDYDELYDVLKTLKGIYPDSYPLYFPNTWSFHPFGLSFGVTENFYLDSEENVVKYAPVQENYRILLEYMAKFYEEGLIPIEFENLDSQKRNELLTTDRTFIYFGYLSSNNALVETVRKNNPDFNLAFMPPPAGPDGRRVNATQYIMKEGLTVTSTSDNIDAAIKYVDYLFSEEGKIANSWGKEGVTYEVVDGEKQFLPEIINSAFLGTEYGIRTSGNKAYGDPEAINSMMTDEMRENYEEGLKYMCPPIDTPPITSEESDAIAVKNDAMYKHMKENICKFVMGERPVSEWVNFVEEMEKLGLNDVLKVYNDALERSRN